jgi:hypothetical protein
VQRLAKFDASVTMACRAVGRRLRRAAVLNALPIHPPDVRAETFRNPAGVNTTLASLRWVDPEIEGGLSRGNTLDRVV